jgi:hypothetical protein
MKEVTKQLIAGSVASAAAKDSRDDWSHLRPPETAETAEENAGLVHRLVNAPGALDFLIYCGTMEHCLIINSPAEPMRLTAMDWVMVDCFHASALFQSRQICSPRSIFISFL